jgi:NAD(P)-dependent dehydrogenase (short-subunit alcohol dehydrogenase family)
MTALLDNKVVMVAGLGGIGNGLARRYFDEGALLVIGDLDDDLARRVAGELDTAGQRVLGVRLDGADEESVIAMVKLAVDTFGAASTACTSTSPMPPTHIFPAAWSICRWRPSTR